MNMSVGLLALSKLARSPFQEKCFFCSKKGRFRNFLFVSKVQSARRSWACLHSPSKFVYILVRKSRYVWTVRGGALFFEEQAQIQALKDISLTNCAIARQLGRSHECTNRFLRNPNAYRSAPVPCLVVRRCFRGRNTKGLLARYRNLHTLSVNQIPFRLTASRAAICCSIRQASTSADMPCKSTSSYGYP